MENDNTGNQILEGDLEKEVIVPGNDEQDVEKLKATISTLSAQKDHWRKKAVDPETGKPFRDLLADAKKVTPPEPPKPNPEPTEDLNEIKGKIGKLEQSEEKRSFGHQNNLSPEETDEVFAYANGMGLSAKDALQKPFVKSAIEATRAQKRMESNLPGSSNRAPKVDGKSWTDMDDNERRKNFGAVAGQFKRQ